MGEGDGSSSDGGREIVKMLPHKTFAVEKIDAKGFLFQYLGPDGNGGLRFSLKLPASHEKFIDHFTQGVPPPKYRRFEVLGVGIEAEM